MLNGHIFFESKFEGKLQTHVVAISFFGRSEFIVHVKFVTEVLSVNVNRVTCVCVYICIYMCV